MDSDGTTQGPGKRDWRDSSAYKAMYAFNRVELDLAFARRHAERLTPLDAPVEVTNLRLHPPVRVLTHAPAALSSAWGLRFRRT